MIEVLCDVVIDDQEFRMDLLELIPLIVLDAVHSPAFPFWELLGYFCYILKYEYGWIFIVASYLLIHFACLL